MQNDLNNLLPLTPVVKKAQDDFLYCGAKRRNVENNELLYPLSNKKSRVSPIKQSFLTTFETVSKRSASLSERGRKVNENTEAMSESYSRKEKLTRLTAEENIKANDSTSPDDKEKVSDNKKAEEIIRSALKDIVQLLHLDKVSVKSLDTIQYEMVSDESLDQFSEIVMMLQGISEILRNAAREGIPVMVNGITMNPQEAGLLERDLKTALFKLEAAFEWLGFAGKIARNIADKSGVPLLDGGIPQAMDPVSISGQQNQGVSFLDNLFKRKEDAISSVISRILASVNGQSNGKQPLPAQEVTLSNPGYPETEDDIKNTPALMESAKGDAEKSASKQTAREISSIDPLVLRRILKIDTAETPPISSSNVSEEVGVVSESLSDNLPSVNVSLLNALKSKLSADTLQKQIEPIPVNLHGSKQDLIRTDAMTKPLFSTFKNIDESIMFQIGKRFSEAIRQGIHEVRIMLKPESLGDVRMTIQMNGDVVMARITVENQHVKQIIESNLQNLKNALEDQNLQAGSFDVDVRKNRDESHENDVFHDNSYSSGHELLDNEIALEGDPMSMGIETGRKFGTNSVEYFA